MKTYDKINNFRFQDYIESELIFGDEIREDVDLTIVIPTYKRNQYLKKTLLSIINQKPVSKLKYQIIVVSNDPDYSLKELDLELDKSLFSVFRNKENLGMVGNINRCACLAKGKFISYIQDDDILLDEYFQSMEILINDDLNKADCIIPNRYYCYNAEDKNSIYGKQMQSSEKKKILLKKFLSFGKKVELLQKITVNDCGNTWYNCFTGGPTCGILFRRDSLMSTSGFSFDYPYSFDYVFFIDFSEKYNVCLYNRFLSVYRMSDSASNSDEVQKDFFLSDMYLLENQKKTNNFVRKYEQEIIKFSVENKSVGAQKLIGASGKNNAKKIKYIYFRIARLIKLMRSNVYRRELMPSCYWDMI